MRAVFSLVIVCFLRVAALAVEDPQPDFDRAVEFLKTGNFDLAVEAFNKVIAARPADAKAYVGRAQALRAKEDIAGASKDYSKAIELDPKLAEAYYGRGELRREDGDLPGAIADWNKAIEIDPTMARAYVRRAIAREDNGDAEGAMADWNKGIELDPKQPLPYFNRGVTWNFRGNHDAAIADWTKALELDPKYFEAYEHRGTARRTVKGDLRGAIEDFTNAIDLNPNSRAFYERGIAYAELGEWARALGDFDALLGAGRGGMFAAFYRFVAQVRLGKGLSAQKELRTLLEKDPKIKGAGWALIVRNFLIGDLTEVEFLASIDPSGGQATQWQTCQAYYFAGMMRVAAGQTVEAAECFRRSVAGEAKTLVEYRLAQAELKRLAPQ